MSNRPKSLRLLIAAFSSLSVTTKDETERPAYISRAILFFLPLAMAGVLLSRGYVVEKPDVLLAAAALLLGAMLAGFSPVAIWRERILEAGREIDRGRRRALDRAGALILLGVHVAVISAVSVFVLTLLDTHAGSETEKVAAVFLSSTALASFAFVALSLVFVANILWDGFVNTGRDIERESLKDFTAADD